MKTIDITVPTEQGPWEIQALQVSEHFCIHGMICGDHEVAVTHISTGRLAIMGTTLAAAAEGAWALERIGIDWSFGDWTVGTGLQETHGDLLAAISRGAAKADLVALRSVGREVTLQ